MVSLSNHHPERVEEWGFELSARFPLDQEAVAAGDRARLDQPVTELMAESRNVDDRQRVGGLEPQPAAQAHARQPLARLQHRQRAVQAP